MEKQASDDFPKIVQNIDQLVTRAPNLTEENKFPQEELMEMFEVFQSMMVENHRGATALDIRFRKMTMRIFWDISFNSYLVARVTSSFDSILLADIRKAQEEESSAEIPAGMTLRVENGKYYIEKAKKCIEEIDKTLPSLFDKVKKMVLKKTQSRIQEHDVVEMEMEAEDIERELEKCKTYQEQAEKAISELKIEIDKELTRSGIKKVAGVAGVVGGFLIGAALLQVNVLANSTVKEIGSRLSGLLGLGGIASLSLSVFLLWKLKIDESRSLLNTELDKLQSELEKVKIKFNDRQGDLAVKVTRRIEKLNN